MDDPTGAEDSVANNEELVAAVSHAVADFFDREPTAQEQQEMHKASKKPSEWLKLLCHDWASSVDAAEHLEAMDDKLLQYKPYTKGRLSAQLLCRFSLPPLKDAIKQTIRLRGLQEQTETSENANTPEGNHPEGNEGGADSVGRTNAKSEPASNAIDALPIGLPAILLHPQFTSPVDIWAILGIEDEFDKAYIVSQIEKFAAIYNIRSSPSLTSTDANPSSHSSTTSAATVAAADLLATSASSDVMSTAAAAAAAAALPNPAMLPYVGPTAAAAALAAAQQLTGTFPSQQPSLTPDGMLKRKQQAQQNQIRVTEDKNKKAREKRRQAQKKKADKEARETTREAKRQHKIQKRQERERYAQEQKQAALRRAAELVTSNRVPIEITRGAAAAKAATEALGLVSGSVTAAPSVVGDKSVPISGEKSSTQVVPKKKVRSAIVVSTAGDLHQIVTHSKNLWAKYNAIAKEHSQKVNWITVSKELGIHVKVREKYARMHSRAEQRGFDWVTHADWRIKDHPEIFLEPTQAEQRAKMPPPARTTGAVPMTGGVPAPALPHAQVQPPAEPQPLEQLQAPGQSLSVPVPITDTQPPHLRSVLLAATTKVPIAPAGTIPTVNPSLTSVPDSVAANPPAAFDGSAPPPTTQVPAADPSTQPPVMVDATGATTAINMDSGPSEDYMSAAVAAATAAVMMQPTEGGQQDHATIPAAAAPLPPAGPPVGSVPPGMATQDTIDDLLSKFGDDAKPPGPRDPPETGGMNSATV